MDYSEIENTVYEAITGKSRNDYLLEKLQKNRGSNFKIEEKKVDLGKNVAYEAALSYGKRKIYPQLHDEWERFVTTYFFEKDESKVIEGVIWLMNIHELGVSTKEATDLFMQYCDYCEEVQDIIPLGFLNFHKKGPDFFEELHGENISSFYTEVVGEKRVRNLLFEREKQGKSGELFTNVEYELGLESYSLNNGSVKTKKKV